MGNPFQDMFGHASEALRYTANQMSQAQSDALRAHMNGLSPKRAEDSEIDMLRRQLREMGERLRQEEAKTQDIRKTAHAQLHRMQAELDALKAEAGVSGPDKTKKLLALAFNSASTEPEAIAAFLKARKLGGVNIH